MAETMLDKQLDALKKQSCWLCDPFTQALPVLKKRQNQKDFVSQYVLYSMDTLQAALCQDMNDSTCFQVALQEMPPKLVTLLIMLLRIYNLELAHTVVSVILGEEPCEQTKKQWAQILHQLLNQLLPHWDHFAIFKLDQDITTVIRRREDYQTEDLQSIKAVCTANLWPGLELLYTEHKDSLLCNAHLNKIMLLAAWSGNWSVFMECLELGANFTETVDVVREGVGSEHVCISQTADQTIMKQVKYSILHEAVQSGLDLQQLELAGQFPEEMVNALDCCGNTLLHWAIRCHDSSVQFNSVQVSSLSKQISLFKIGAAVPGESASPRCSATREVVIKNVLFLMKHKADVNIVNKSGMTAIQDLVGRGYFEHHGADMLVAMVEGTDKIEPHSWAPVEEWSVLCWLCVSGKYQHVLTAVEKGADVKRLYFKLTLIDMVILQENVPYDLKEQTLAVLLNKPISLGAFHASVVAQRPLSEENMVYRDKIGPGIHRSKKPYVYPVLRLLFPIIYWRGLQKKHVNLVKMLVEGDAVCDAELLALKPYILLLKIEDMHEAVEYLLPLIEALPPSATASPQ